MIVCNTRILSTPLTGVQRYTQELLRRLPSVTTIQPGRPLNGLKGHFWEQFILPFRIQNNVLWSPSNTGPVWYSNQVVTIHDLAIFESPEGFSTTFKAAYKFILPRIVRRARHILTVSEYSKSRITTRFGVPQEKVTVTPLGVDHLRFRPHDQRQHQALCAKLSLPQTFVLFLGSISARKNVQTLLNAWKDLLGKIPDDVHLVLAGGAGKTNVFRGTRFENLPPRVICLPHVDDEDLPCLLSAAQVFAFPSRYEGFGLPPLEAMACGTPCVVSTATSLPEVVGDAALMASPKDVRAWSTQLVRLLSDPALRKKTRLKGLDRAAKFTWERTAALTRAVLETI